MSDGGLPDPTQFKLFPRNLTARADALVRGNPASTRPESGVDNCYPGLEFDQRNLDKAFFPGLVFEFHRPDGAILHEIRPPGPLAREILPGGRRPAPVPEGHGRAGHGRPERRQSAIAVLQRAGRARNLAARP